MPDNRWRTGGGQVSAGVLHWGVHPLALLASIMLVFVLVGALVRSRTTSPIPGVGRAQWQHLLTIARGDEAAARSMIEGEQKRRPGSTAAEACRRVIARYERDNR